VTPPVAAKRLVEIRQKRGQVWMLLSRYPEAIAEFEQMLEITRVAGIRRGEGEALADLAYAHWMTFSSEHIPYTKKFSEEALAIARETDDRRVLAKSLSYLGSVYQVEGDLAEADRKLEESLRISQEAGFKDIVALNQVWLAAHANWRAEFRKAIPLCRKAEQAAGESHDGLSELIALAFCCLAHIGLGEYAEALAVINEGLSKARDRENTFIVGRLTNTLGWFHQELGDFTRAIEYDHEGHNLGLSAKNPNVEISSLINLGFDHLNLGEPARALALFEETLVRVEKFFVSAHRWRWAIHVRAYLAEALLATGEPGKALITAEHGLAQARSTGSVKYIGKYHVLKGQIALEARQWGQAEVDLSEALRLAQEIGYPTLTWQAAHLLARTQAGQTKMEDAFASARLAAETIDAMAARILEPAVQRTFLAWPRIETVRDEVDRLRRS